MTGGHRSSGGRSHRLFGTKAALLEELVRLAIRGDLEDVEMPQRQAVARVEAAPDARTMLKLHAAHLRQVNERSAGLAWTVEQAVPSDAAVAHLWDQMNRNRTTRSVGPPRPCSRSPAAARPAPTTRRGDLLGRTRRRNVANGDQRLGPDPRRHESDSRRDRFDCASVSE